MAASTTKVPVEVDGRSLTLSNLDKVLWPDAGFTKGEMIDYYTRIAPTLLPHIEARALTVKRYPNGVDEKFFFEKNASRGTPEWVRTVNLPAPGSTKNRERIDYIVCEELATVVWLANLAAIEWHVPQWSVAKSTRTRDSLPTPDLLVFDLDPGPPATSVQCARVALLLKEIAEDDGLTTVVKLSGSKGMQVYAPVTVTSSRSTSDYARSLAERLEASHDDLVVSRMTKAIRGGKVLVDWSQNNPAKTTVAPYSLRARAVPSVSAPLTWDEVEHIASSGEEMRLLAPDVLARVEADGDLFAPLLGDDHRAALP
ncbi:non-homologous end-joining DNA ligase [Jatrophihabitans sp. YIM 134969]